MGNISLLSKRTEEKKENITDFRLIDLSTIENTVQYFCSKYDYDSSLLDYLEFGDVFSSLFGEKKSLKQFDIFGPKTVSCLEIILISYLLCSNRLLSIDTRLDLIMSFFQFKNNETDNNDNNNTEVKSIKTVRKDEVFLLLETAVVALSRLIDTDIVDQQYTISITDGIFEESNCRSWSEAKILILMHQVCSVYVCTMCEYVLCVCVY